MNTNERRCAGMLSALALAASCATAAAQNYPTGPVRIIVPFPAGGGVDTTGRLIGQRLADALGKQFVIDNRPGANGMMAPAGAPGDILGLLSSHVVKIMQGEDMKKRMADGGSVAVGSTREEFAAHIRDEFAKWAKVIRQSGAKVD